MNSNTKKMISKRSKIMKKQKEFVLSPALQEDISVLEQQINLAQMRFQNKKAELDRIQAEISGLDLAIYSFFKSDALTKGAIGKGEKIVFLGNFKYSVQEVDSESNKEEQTEVDKSSNETTVPVDDSDNLNNEA